MVANIFGTLFVVTCNFISGRATVALAEWLRRVPPQVLARVRISQATFTLFYLFHFSILFQLELRLQTRYQTLITSSTYPS